ncbi:hypothetical protein BSU01_14410 [Erwinia billingiae]|uniref:hypothetical protein n=1 Tax=Erwinia billingiae TaxID=182337 RepID=UPI0019D1548E|nr:hypothetical protein [Erwinia billingiae]MBN7122893.1 hypothetical protein [Erwinia billingiae]
MADSAEDSAPAVKVETKGPGYILVVRHAFADYQVGEEISDTASMTEILEGEQAVYVIKRAA